MKGDFPISAKRIKQSTINACAAIFLTLMLAFLIVGGYALRSSSRNAAAAAAQESAAHLLGDAMNRESDFLTDQVRSFAVTHERSAMDAYWKALESALERDRSPARASALRLPDEELAALRRAKGEASVLLGMELRAMRLVAEAIGMPRGDMPPAMAADPPFPADRGLSAQGKSALARELAFGTEYWEHKRAMRDAVEEFRALSQDRTTKSVRAAQAEADRNFAFVTALCLTAFLGMIAVTALYYRFVALPIRHYMRTIAGDDPNGYPALRPEGAYELASLAEAINKRRAQRIKVEQALRESELRLRTNLLMMPLAALESDSSGRILSWNPAAELMFGYTEREAVGSDILELIVPERLRGEIGRVIERLNSGDVIDRHVNTNVRKDGREIACEWYNTPIYDSRDSQAGWASIVRDITAQQAEAEKVLYLSRHDPLTGLLNRRSMREKLEEEAQRCKRTGGSYAAIMLDIDWFKTFNDRYGHECGDVVLKGVADAMTKAVRSTDSVGRWGGEEFLILMPETEVEGGASLAEKVRARIEGQPIAYGENRFRVTVTAGIAACEAGGTSVDDCVRLADEALLAGKADGRNKVARAS